MRITSIQTRLLIILLPFFILSFAVLSGISYYLSYQSLTKNVNGMAMAVGSGYANRVEAKMTENMLQLTEIANNPVIRAGNDRDQIIATLADSYNRLGKFDTMNFIWPDGNSVRPDGSTVNLVNRDQYIKVIETKKPYVTRTLTNIRNGKLAVVLAVPVINNGQLTGILTATYTLEAMTELVKEIKFKDSGYGFMYDDQGTLIIEPSKPEVNGKMNLMKKEVDPDLKLTDTQLDDRFIGLVKAGIEKQVIGKYKFGGIDRLGIFTPIELPGQKWVVVVTVPEAEVTQDTTTLNRILMIVSLLFVLFGSLFIVKISKLFARPIKLVRDECLLLAQGDFRDTEAKVTSEDEIGQLAQGFREMRHNVRSMVIKVQSQAEQVAASSEELTASAEQSSQASNQIASSITNVASGADEQLQAVDETSSIVGQMSASIQQIAADTNNVAAQSLQASGSAKEGGQAVEKAVSQMVQIEDTVNTSAKVVAQLGERSKKIGQIVDTISGIAGQTNLLALNAAIEAARAGEQGRGFAVVAEEVRQLAEQSQEAAKKIAELIREIQGDTDRAVVAMNDGTKEVRTGAEVVNAAGVAFREIVELVTQVSDQVRGISAAIQQMASSSQHIVSSVTKIDAISKKSAGESQSVSAATEQQLASMEEIAGSSEALSKLAQDLQVAVAKFRI